MNEQELTELATPNNPSAISWTASEYVAHDKTAGWYVLLAVAAAAIALLVFWVSRDAVSVGVVVVAALLLGVFASRPPRQLQYSLDQQGIKIAEKFYPYQEFRSFSVLPEGAFSSIVFMPLKRFGTATTIYFAPDDEDKILNLLADRLPFEQLRRDAVDSLMRRIRF